MTRKKTQEELHLEAQKIIEGFAKKQGKRIRALWKVARTGPLKDLLTASAKGVAETYLLESRAVKLLLTMPAFVPDDRSRKVAGVYVEDILKLLSKELAALISDVISGTIPVGEEKERAKFLSRLERFRLN
jgi:hypothetical protein